MPRIDRSSLGDQLADRLRVQIINGSIAPGTHLVEDALAEEFDVSRGPVRDALRALSAEWLIEAGRRGFRVRGISADDIDELYSLRGAIESLAGVEAIDAVSVDAWTSADDEVREMFAAAEASDWHRFARSDLRFHTLFYANSGNRRLQALWEQYRPTFGALLDITNSQDLDLRPSADDHRALLDRIIAGDKDGFVHELARHLAGSQRRMVTAMQAHLVDVD